MSKSRRTRSNTINPKPKDLVITIAISEGRQYRVGDITFSGNKLYPADLLKRLVKQRKGTVFVPSKLDRDAEKLQDFYGRDGYLDTRVRLVRKPNIDTGNIDVEYNILESEKFNVESVHIEGNTKTKNTVILRELTLGPGDVFNAVSMKISKLRLDNTRFFEDVNATDEQTNLPGRRNLKIAVKEGAHGQSLLRRGLQFAGTRFGFRGVHPGEFRPFQPSFAFPGRRSEVPAPFVAWDAGERSGALV